ncbi:TIGR01244 family sulfur transferase [Aurantiacibacter gilvus]|uniref:TIGR01244 family sulfur transferase n=1 Tax=Aurantiacibacter gilvus TaxID=3139141 RepID=A0ABU9IEW5_9SPHN
MQVNKVSDKYSVAGQILPADVAALKEAGFGTIICNRPDGEAEGQPPVAEIAQAAAAAGLAFEHNPIESGAPTPEAVARQGELCAAADAPVFAYCASGKRSTMLWTLANPEGLDADERLSCAEAAGYDFEALRPQL